MRFLVAVVAMGVLAGPASAETKDCKTLTDPAARLTCYDKINPPIATFSDPAAEGGTPDSTDTSRRDAG